MTLKFSGTYNVEAAEQVDRSSYQNSITCNVWLLDSTAVAFRVDRRCNGQTLLDLTFDFLELLERDFFGLVYTFSQTTEGSLTKWLDPTKKIRKQCKGEVNFAFWFRVKFYVPDPIWLQEEYTRYQFFLQIRKDILDGRLPVPKSIATQLAGLALQSELGDYTPEECRPGYVSQFRFVQNQNADFEAQATEWHRKSSSLLPAAAELEYLNVVRYLDHYGVKSHVVKDEQHNLQTTTIGVSFIGISLFRDNRMLQQYSWDNISKINFKGKRFTIHFKTNSKSMNGHITSSSVLTSPILNLDSELKQHYRFSSAVSTKIFWQYAVSCHAFFRVREPNSTTQRKFSTTTTSATGFNQQTSASTVSATALYAAMSRIASGFQRYFSITRRSSLSTATPNGPVGGVGRTMSTLMELRRNARAFERSFSRTHSRRSNPLPQVSSNQFTSLLSKPDVSTSLLSGNPIDSVSTTGNQSKTYSQIPPGAKLTGGSANSGIFSDNKLARSSYRSSSTNQNRESSNILSSHTQTITSGKAKKSTTDTDGFANVNRSSSQLKQISNEASSQKHPTSISSNHLDKPIRNKSFKLNSPAIGVNGSTRVNQRRLQQAQQQSTITSQNQPQETNTTSHQQHHQHPNVANDSKSSSRRAQKLQTNENIVEHPNTDTVDGINNTNNNTNQDLDKDETTTYWNTRRIQRLQAHTSNNNTTNNNNNSLHNITMPSLIPVTSTVSTSTPMTTNISSKTHSTSNINKHNEIEENDCVNYSRAPTIAVRRSRHAPNDQTVITVNDSNVNNDDIQCLKSSRASLNNNGLNRSNNSSRNQLNHSFKGHDQSTNYKKEHSDVTNNNGNDVDNFQHSRNKGFLKDPFHPGAPDVENLLLQSGEINEFNSEGLVRISIRPDSHGRFGFNVKGGIDHGMPIIVSRVGANMPADLCIPRLSEGDQILFINHKDVSNQTHLQVVNMIRTASEQPYGTLELLVKPSDYVTDDVNDDNPIPDSGDAPPIPPRSYQSSIRRSSLSLEKIARNSKRLTRFSLKSTFHNAIDRDHTTNVQRNSFSGSALLDSMIELETHLADGSLLNQFEHLPRRKSGLTMNVSRLSENSIKNRYRDISPYDQTRVILKQGSGDYINASFVNMEFPNCGVNLRYIAAQGPLPNTYSDFWQMCWEQQVHLIVMLTAISERGRAKCHQYWPDLNSTVNFSVSTSPRITQSRNSTDLQLKTVREEINTDVAYREFDIVQIPSHRGSFQSVLRKNMEARRILQLQYINWPDHGVPNDADQLISFVEQVQRIRGENLAPVVVHCSAGIGRTGVLIAIETSINLMVHNYPIKPIELVQRMREHRAMLIQTTGQFQFVCETILKVFHRNHAENLLKNSTSMTIHS
ncbi:Tyrosine-protein phosphatase 1 isoform 1 [Schistosoma japonicum]|uniref:protein-tyrosine-phosphatase n=1 Tax=Schistosoma japonicum TaxID=6182 RepID=A0A4Z2DLC7_SCHJA|nr:Tyrosine-protein phosphatase 1 isoform 1 [Schistosoma japonicum]